MNRLSALAMLIAVSALARADDKKYWVFLGTSTGKSTSKGIYRAEFDTATGRLGESVLAAEVTQPTFLAVHPSGKFLYSVGEVNVKDGKKAGGVHAFSLDAKTGDLKKLNDSDSGGPGPCHVMCDREGKCLLVANYSGGSVKCLKLEADGRIGSESSFHQHTGSSVNAARQKEPHAHSVNVSPDNKFAVVADLGTDKLMVYKLDAANAKLTPHDPPFVAILPGSGPRHFVWHPDGKTAYTNGELDARVHALSYDAAKGTFQAHGVAATLPSKTSDEDRQKNTTAEIVAHPNGKTLFVSNRGHNSIAILEIVAGGAIVPTGHITGGISVPRNFNIDPTGKWILVANQDGKSVTVFGWNDEKREATPTMITLAIDKPMCIKFVERK